MTPAIIEGPYLRDILEQPAALARTVAGLQDDPAICHLATSTYRRIILTGSGRVPALSPLHLKLN